MWVGPLRANLSWSPNSLQGNYATLKAVVVCFTVCTVSTWCAELGCGFKALLCHVFQQHAVQVVWHHLLQERAVAGDTTHM
jgi:hypothetical protein